MNIFTPGGYYKVYTCGWVWVYSIIYIIYIKYSPDGLWMHLAYSDILANFSCYFGGNIQMILWWIYRWWIYLYIAARIWKLCCLKSSDLVIGEYTDDIMVMHRTGGGNSVALISLYANNSLVSANSSNHCRKANSRNHCRKANSSNICRKFVKVEEVLHFNRWHIFNTLTS